MKNGGTFIRGRQAHQLESLYPSAIHRVSPAVGWPWGVSTIGIRARRSAGQRGSGSRRTLTVRIAARECLPGCWRIGSFEGYGVGALASEYPLRQR